jgi:hypothetical protein
MLREVFGRTAWLGTDAPDFARQTHHAAAQPDPSPWAAGQTLAASLTWQAAAHSTSSYAGHWCPDTPPGGLIRTRNVIPVD